jgi:transcriptional regulator of arginine metabolism
MDGWGWLRLAGRSATWPLATRLAGLTAVNFYATVCACWAVRTAMPIDPELRGARQQAIRGVLARAPVASQAQLVAELRRLGIAATQSSISRDLRDLGVARVGGRYVPGVPGLPGAAGEERDPRDPPRDERDPDVAEVARLLRRVRPAGPHLTVVQTAVGAAQGVARAFDAAAWPEVVGTLAGDDTVFIATATEGDQTRLRRRLAGFFKEG